MTTEPIKLSLTTQDVPKSNQTSLGLYVTPS